MYDVLAGKENMESSYVMSKGKALETFPMLKADGLVGALVYYDGESASLWIQDAGTSVHLGQHNDSRMNTALIMTAVQQGATVANYVEVTELHKDANGKLYGARVHDRLTGKQWNVRAQVSTLSFFSCSALSSTSIAKSRVSSTQPVHSLTRF